MPTMADLQTKCSPNWCPGCGNLPLWAAFKQAAVKEGWDNTNTAYVAGIGCHGHIVNFTKLTAFEGLHGRSLPVAAGLKIANNRLNVFAFAGDGDCLAEGGNHFIHACRRNHDITLMLHDNGLYALTTGQTSPASPHGYETKSTPQGNPDYPLNPLAMAIAAGATFVAREFTGNMKSLSELMIQANNHRGFAVIDIMQPCHTFNKLFTHEFFQENSYYLSNDPSYDPTNKVMAFAKAQEFGIKQIPLGILYKEDKPTYEDQLPQIKDKPLVEIEVHRDKMADLYAEYM